MSGRAVVDTVMFGVGAALLLVGPVRGRIPWAWWAAVAAAGFALGVVVAAVARELAGRPAVLAFAALLVPTGVLAAVGAAYGYAYLVAHSLGLVAGRKRYPAARHRRAARPGPYEGGSP